MQIVLLKNFLIKNAMAREESALSRSKSARPIRQSRKDRCFWKPSWDWAQTWDNWTVKRQGKKKPEKNQREREKRLTKSTVAQKNRDPYGKQLCLLTKNDQTWGRTMRIQSKTETYSCEMPLQHCLAKAISSICTISSNPTRKMQGELVKTSKIWIKRTWSKISRQREQRKKNKPKALAIRFQEDKEDAKR